MSDDRANGQNPVTRLVDLVVHAPIGVLAYLRDMGPTMLNVLISRGRRELAHTSSQVRTHATDVGDHVRTLGDAAASVGVPVVGHITRWVGRPDTESSPSEAYRTTETEIHIRDEVAESTSQPDGPPATDDAPPSSDLAIPGYDSLSASQVVDRIVGLDARQLGAVRSYEDSNRRRRTILGKIDQLTA